MEGVVLSQKYKIIRLINGGSFCKLYEAIHIYKKQTVAIKCESSEIGKKVLDNEINMYIYLKKYKINIPNIKDIGIYENYKYIVMDLLEVTLKDFVIKYKQINIEILINKVFYVIQPFHERMLVHRDIKPENFIFDNKWNIYIIDLGLSTFVSERKMKTFIGNKLYASYNCHLSEYIYRQNDDLISIVYMLLHLYTGKLPWDKTPFDETMIKSKSKSLFTLDFVLEHKFNSDSHSEYYNLKKNTNYSEYYKKIEKYDKNVQYLLDLYDEVNN